MTSYARQSLVTNLYLNIDFTELSTPIIRNMGNSIATKEIGTTYSSALSIRFMSHLFLQWKLSTDEALNTDAHKDNNLKNWWSSRNPKKWYEQE